MIFSIYCTYDQTMYSCTLAENRLFDVATDKETHLKTNYQTSSPGPAMTHVVLFIHANLAVREGFQQSQEWWHIGKLPPATVETSSFVDNGRCTSSVPIWNSRFGSCPSSNHPIFSRTIILTKSFNWHDYLTPWLDLWRHEAIGQGTDIWLVSNHLLWLGPETQRLVKERPRLAEVNPLGWHPKIVETYQLIRWHHLSSTSNFGWHLFVERWSWIMILTYTCHMSPGVPGYDSNPFHINFVAKWQRHSCNSLWSLDGPRQSCPPQPKHGASLDAQPNEAVL